MLPSIDPGITNSLLEFLPELVLVLGIVLMLLLRLVGSFNRSHLGGFSLTIGVIALFVSLLQALGEPGLKSVLEAVSLAESSVGKTILSLAQTPPPAQSQSMMFGGMLIYDQFTIFLRILLYVILVLVILLTMTTGIPDAEDSADFYCLLLGGTLGMVLMAASAHLLMVFLAIEMASLPSYALAGFLKGRRQSSEAALKYVVYGGGAAGIMLYGISLLAGKFGTGYLPELSISLAAAFVPSAEGIPFDPILILATLFLLIGIAFKLAAVPFHFWCPDVFEGAAAEVAGFLSVASKAAALALLARLTMFVGGLDPLTLTEPAKELPYLSIIRYLVPTLAVFAAITATFGNLAAYLQTNLKRLLAYSTIAHAGYMMMALCTLTRNGVDAMLFYLVAYLFMNLGAFAVVAYLRNQTRSEDLADFRGLVRRSPIMVVTLSVFLLSLLGIPPLVGFAAKFQVFAALFNDGQRYFELGEKGIGTTLLVLLLVGGVNTVLSAFYYLKVMKVMILDPRVEDLEGQEAQRYPEPIGASLYTGVLAVLVLLLGILWGPLVTWSQRTVDRFRVTPGKDRSMLVASAADVEAGGAGGVGRAALPKGKGNVKGKGGFDKGKKQ